MKIVVISDSHRNKSLISEIYHKHQDADYFLDAGDSMMTESDIAPFLSVRGNGDFFISNPHRVISVGFLKIFITHGHRFLLEKKVLAQIAKTNNCNMLIHGHTHVPYFDQVDGIYLLCPGSISRGRSSKGNTYAIIHLANQEDVTLEWVKV